MRWKVISTLFVAIILFVGFLVGVVYFQIKPKTYIDNGELKLENHPSASRISSKAFGFFGEIVSENHPYYEVKIYSDRAILMMYGQYKIEPTSSKKISSRDLSYSDIFDEIILRGNRKLILEKELVFDY